jgi:NADH dehydrogenase
VPLARGRIRATLVDVRPFSESLPLLPDLISGTVSSAACRYPLAEAGRRWGVRFVQARAEAIDTARRRVRTSRGVLAYDALILACGSRTNFRGRGDLADRCERLDGVDDGLSIVSRLRSSAPRTVVVCGGGYTGVEIVTHLWRRFPLRGRHAAARPRLVLVEYSDRLCPPLPQRFRAYTETQVRGLGVEVRLEDTVSAVEGETVSLASGARFERAMCIWAAGVTGPPILEGLPGDRLAGRLVVDEDLRFGERELACGDAAAFLRGQSPIRMSVQHAIGGGEAAAENALRLLAGRSPRRFRPLDLGYLVPMAHGRSCGQVLGLPVYGRAATALHYLMCAFRSQSPEMAGRVLVEALRSRGGGRQYS